MTPQEVIEILTNSNIKLWNYMINVLPDALKQTGNKDLIINGYATIEDCEKEYEACKLAIEALEKQESIKRLATQYEEKSKFSTEGERIIMFSRLLKSIND